MATIDGFLAEWKSGKPMIEAHTSGSTGTPKPISLHKSDMLVSARATNKYFGICHDSVLALPLSVDYIAGKMMVVRAQAAGCKLVQLPVSNDIAIPDDIDHIDLLPIVPSQIASLLSQPQLATKIQNVLIGGASPSPEDCHQLTLCGYKAFISYGMTETCSHVALAHADDSRRVFFAMPGISFATDADSRLIIEAPEYTFKSLVTNDIATLLSPNAMIWRGRADGIINSGGLKLVPEELEALYLPILTGRKYFVAGFPDSKWGQAVTLIIEADTSETEKIMQELKSGIADHRLIPKKIIAVDSLPTAANGKIKRDIKSFIVQD